VVEEKAFEGRSLLRWTRSKMPLLNKNPFVPDPIPSDLRPDEEIFVCQATKEVFRDYE